MARPPGALAANKKRASAMEAERRARFLERLLGAIGSSPSPSDLLSSIVPAFVDVAGDWCAIWLWDRYTGEPQLTGAYHRDREKFVLVQRLAEGWLHPKNHGVLRDMLGLARTRTLSIAGEEQAEEVFGSRELAQLALRPGAASLILAPLVLQHQRFGLVAIGSAQSSAFSDREVALVGDLIHRTGEALAHLQWVDVARQASQQLAISGLRLRAVVESIPQGLIIADADGRVVNTNRSLARLLGGESEVAALVAGHPVLARFLKPEGQPYSPRDLPWVRAALAGRPILAEEIIVQRPDGTSATALCSASPILEEEEKATGAVAVLQDITKRKEFERQKDEFLTMISHELKNPMASVKGYAQLLQRWMSKQPRPPFGRTEEAAAEAIQRQVSRMSRMVTELVDFSKIQMGRLELRREMFNLGELASDVVAHTEVTAPDRLWKVVVRGDTTVNADPSRIEQVLVNLVSNAVKATAKGGRIEVSVRPKGKWVIASVHDDGVGIPREDQQRTFERLYHAHARYEKGLGLGLCISKGIVDEHGGRIWFESQEGKGTTFSFQLPASETGGRGLGGGERIGDRVDKQL